MTSEEILTYFYETFNFKKNKDGWVVNLDLNNFKYKNLPFNLVDPNTNEVVAYKDVKLSLKLLKEIKDKKINKFLFKQEDLYGFYLSNDIVNYDNGLVYAEAGSLLSEEFFKRLEELSINQFSVINANQATGNLGVINSLVSDKTIHERKPSLIFLKF